MCGIIGYSGLKPAAPLLLASLRRLEYRGYDSAGIAVLDRTRDGAPTVVKSELKVADLEARVLSEGMPAGLMGIGHTRWATHGRPTMLNAHPHQDCSGRLHLIHNGIIENFRELREELLSRGHRFASDTDTEVVPHLIEEYYSGDLAAATRHALTRIQGAYALVIIHSDEPDRIVGARLNAPLVIGLGDSEVYISSDITALIPYTKRVVLLGEGEMVSATPTSIEITASDGTAVEPRVVAVDWEASLAEKGGYPHFMLKEIHEQPESLRNALRDRITETGMVHLPDVPFSDAELASLDSVTIVACGTALYAGQVARIAIEKLARVRVTLEAASEYRYSDPVLGTGSLVVAISQSGETADTMAAVREAQRRGARVVAITNVVGSALAVAADGVIFMQSGPEISVAATKTFISQMACGLLLAIRIADARGTLTLEAERELTEELQALPAKLEQTLLLEPQMTEIAHRYGHCSNALYIARGINVPIALEGALKLKEVSYLHAEGYAAGELKHGPIALLSGEVPVIAIATRAATLTKMVSNIEEVLARDTPVIALITAGENPFDSAAVSDVVEVPACPELLSPLLNVVPLQLFAYHVAVARGCDVDQPRNLAKSVTVE